MPKTMTKKTENKKHLAFVKFSYKWLKAKPNNLDDIENYDVIDIYKYFLADSLDVVMQHIQYHATQTGCLHAESISKEQYEKAIGVNNESNTKV